MRRPERLQSGQAVEPARPACGIGSNGQRHNGTCCKPGRDQAIVTPPPEAQGAEAGFRGQARWTGPRVDTRLDEVG